MLNEETSLSPLSLVSFDISPLYSPSPYCSPCLLLYWLLAFSQQTMLFQAFKHPASSAWRYFPLFFAWPLLTHQGSASTLREASHNQLFPQAPFSTCTPTYDNCFMPIYWPPSPQWILHTGNPQNLLQSWYTKRIFNIMSSSFPSGKHCWGGKQRARSTLWYPLPGLKFPVLSLASCGTLERPLLLSVPQLPHLQSENTTSCITELLWRLHQAQSSST